jgi:hypothetical protein
VTGEASPYYMFHPRVPDRVNALLPHVKLIALVRDPVERTFSAYHHQVRRGSESLSFVEAIEQEPHRLAGEVEKLMQDDTYRSHSHRHHSYLARGIYADQLDAWLRVFPRPQMLVIKSEDFFDRPADVVGEVLTFLGLPPFTSQTFQRFNVGEYEQMDPEVRKRLVEYFAPRNERLYKLLGRDFGWPR